MKSIRLKPYNTTRPQSCVPPPSSKLNLVALLLAGAAGDLSRLPAGRAAVFLPGAGHPVDGQAPAPDSLLHAAAARFHPGRACGSLYMAHCKPFSSLNELTHLSCGCMPRRQTGMAPAPFMAGRYACCCFLASSRCAQQARSSLRGLPLHLLQSHALLQLKSGASIFQSCKISVPAGNRMDQSALQTKAVQRPLMRAGKRACR